MKSEIQFWLKKVIFRWRLSVYEPGTQ